MKQQTLKRDDTYFISLGAGHHQLPLIRAARELGLGVIAVDRNLKAPGFELANIHLQCNVLRPGRILQLIRENLTHGEIAGVGCRSYGIVNYSAAILARSLGTPGLTRENVRAFRDKKELKKRLGMYDIPVPVSYDLESKQDRKKLPDALPLIARPAMGHGKQGISILRTEEELESFLDGAENHENRILVEDLLDGREITVIGLVRNGKFFAAAVSDKITSKEPPMFAEVMHRFPARLSPKTRKKILSCMQKIAGATGIKNGPLVAEFLLVGTDTNEEFFLVECAPEAGGEYIADFMVPAVTGKNFFQEAVRLYIGLNDHEDLFPLPEEKDSSRVVIRYIIQKDGKLTNLKFPERLYSHPGLIFAKHLKHPGEKTSVSLGNLDRLAVFILKGSMEQAFSLDIDVENIVRDTVVEYEESGQS